MKRISAWTVAIFILLTSFLLAACSEVDRDYGVSSNMALASSEKVETETVSKIISDDEVMPQYIDISLFDEENYSDIYLGKKFKYNVVYNGGSLSAPSSYKEMTKLGWTLLESEDYNVDSNIRAGKSLEVQFVDAYNKQITAVFYNGSDSSVSLKKCKLVKFVITENLINKPETAYGQFWINGVTNQSAITDIIEYLGTPSHFINMTSNVYKLDYFISEADRRSGITLWVDIENDNILSLEFSCY